MHLMIRPIMPYDVPKFTENPFVLISGFVLLFMAVLTAVFVSRYAAEVYKGNKKKTTLFFVGITAFVTLMLFCFFGCAATAVKGCIFCLLLLLSSYEDIRIRECEDYVHLMIVIAAFIGTDTTEELRRMKGCEGLVLQGCDGDLKEWQQSINDIFTDEGLLLDSTKFENIYVFQYTVTAERKSY